VAGNTVLNSAISAQKYSYASSPTGFVHWFDYSETWTGFSSAPSGGICRFKIEGRLATLQLMRTTHGTSNSSSITVTLPVTASSVTNYKLYGPGCAYDNGAYQAHFGVYGISAGGTTATLYKNTDGSSAWTSSGNKNWNGLIIWEI
jgi:hypothetical protein